MAFILGAATNPIQDGLAPLYPPSLLQTSSLHTPLLQDFGEISHYFITGQNGVHLVREISPWSSQVLCIGLAQNLKPILSDDKYWNINPNISAFGM